MIDPKNEDPKEDVSIVFLTPHRHGGVDYLMDDTAMVTAIAADKLIKRSLAKLNPAKKEVK